MSSLECASPVLEVVQSIEGVKLPVEIGILPNGIPFMSGRELARACGISNSTLVGWGEMTPHLGDRHRAGKLAELLLTYRYQGDRLFIPIPEGTIFSGRANVSAYPYQVCLAFLDYYAFEANKEAARNSLRVLSEKQLPQFIVNAVIGQPESPANPESAEPRSNPFQDRPLRNGIPVGYFSVIQLITETGQRSLLHGRSPVPPLGTHTHIDKAWNRYWSLQGIDQRYGDRFPLPQSDHHDWSCPRKYVYPKAALEEFQTWLDHQYIPERFPSYWHRRRHTRRAFSSSWAAAS
ncbi:MAG: hypothetical protein ACFBSG_19595 [Leptolyngbyaceae cyanobacterium]